LAGKENGMTVKSVRFSQDGWRLIRAEAERQGVSASQYLREAGLARAWFEIGQRDDAQAAEAKRWLDAAQVHER
jgi:mobilization protein NikA